MFIVRQMTLQNISTAASRFPFFATKAPTASFFAYPIPIIFRTLPAALARVAPSARGPAVARATDRAKTASSLE